VLDYCSDCAKAGASEKTVKCDLKRLEPYYERKIRHYQDLLKKQHDEQFDAEFEGKSLTEQFGILKKRSAEIVKMLKQREYNHCQILQL
jgi:hypothetical protein